MGFRSFHPNVKLRIVLSFFISVLGNMVTPFMAVYLAKTVGTTMAGVAAMASIGIGVACAAYGGHLADRIGRKRLIVLAEGLSVLAFGTMALFNSPWLQSAIVTMVMTMLLSVSWIGKPAVEAMLIDVSTPETRQAIYRINYWSNNLAISIAGVVGAYLFSAYLFELLLGAAFISLIAAILIGAFLTETMPGHAGAGRSAAASAAPAPRVSFIQRYREVFRDRRFILFVLSGVLIVSVEMNMNGYIGVRLEQEMHQAAWLPGLPWTIDGLPMLGLLRTENTLAIVLFALFAARWLKRRSDYRTMLVAMAFNIVGYVYLVVSNQPSLLVLAMVVATLGELAYVPLRQALMVQLVPDHARSSYMAVNSMTNRVSQVISGLNVVIGGFLAPGGMAVWILATGIAGLALLAGILPGIRRMEAAQAAASGQAAS
ncbi:MFS transporter [Cohnella sp. REN36]|uniref:MFS transporter n=1 Tax=Cohnella sp. REN36 TaxID=2887347 RepID=UPI001D143F11|nr:MFS transporter [Cohnella sp. REN36]MCC3377282.1 MFS transporter [Cohnella sp. REN36]